METFEATLRQEVREVFDWNCSKRQSGPWAKQDMLSVWFLIFVGKGQMIAALQVLHQIMVDQNYIVHGESVRCALELSAQRRPMGMAHALLPRQWKRRKGIGKTSGQLGTIQITMYDNFGDERRCEVAAKFMPTKRGRSCGACFAKFVQVLTTPFFLHL